MQLNSLTNLTNGCTQGNTDLLIKTPLLEYVNPKLMKYQKYKFLNRVQDQDKYMVVNNCQLHLSWLTMYFNRDLRELNTWINKNIVLCLGDICERTADVRIRIATSMLNKCYSIDDDTKRMVHTRLIHRLKLEFYSVVNEQLPF